MKKRWYIAATACAVCVTSACILVPPALFRIQDREALGRVHTEAAKQSGGQDKHTLTLAEKLEFYDEATSYSYDGYQKISSIPVEQGTRLYRSVIWDVCRAELDKLAELDLIPERVDVSAIEKRYAASYFYLNTMDPSQNMIAWTAEFIGEDFEIMLHIDDETEKILKFLYRRTDGKAGADETIAVQADLEATAEKWAEYLGMEYGGRVQRNTAAVSADAGSAVGSSAAADGYVVSEERIKTQEYGLPGAWIQVRYTAGETAVEVMLAAYPAGYSFGSFGAMYGL